MAEPAPATTAPESKAGTSSPGASKQLPQYIAAVSACLGSVAGGAVLGWTANINVQLTEEKDLNDISINADEFGWIGSIATLGALVMCFATGFLCNWIGRRWTMLLLALPLVLGWLLIIFAQNVDMIYAGRFFSGLASGAFCIAAPLYTSEISENAIRGRLGSFFQLMLTVGILLAYIFPLFANVILHTILCGIIPLIFAIVFFFQPETPIHLYKKGKIEAAEKSLQRLRGRDYDIAPEMATIKADLEETERNKAPFFRTLRQSKAAKKATLICFALMFFQQMSGVNAVIFYTGKIFEAAGIALDAKYATLIIGIVQCVATGVASLIIDKAGRKLLLIISAVIMGLSAILLGAFFSIQKSNIDKDTMNTLGFIPVLALSVFMIVYSLGIGPIPWMISAELLPVEIKAIMSSAAGTLNWLVAFLVTRFYNDIQASIGGDVTFYIFGGIMLLCGVFVLFFVPETKGKSLQEIQQILSGNKNSEDKDAKNEN